MSDKPMTMEEMDAIPEFWEDGYVEPPIDPREEPGEWIDKISDLWCGGQIEEAIEMLRSVLPPTEEEEAQRYGGLVSAARERLGLTPDDVAERTQLDPQRVQAIEAGAGPTRWEQGQLWPFLAESGKT